MYEYYASVLKNPPPPLLPLYKTSYSTNELHGYENPTCKNVNNLSDKRGFSEILYIKKEYRSTSDKTCIKL
jgi:hypothetical protein